MLHSLLTTHERVSGSMLLPATTNTIGKMFLFSTKLFHVCLYTATPTLPSGLCASAGVTLLPISVLPHAMVSVLVLTSPPSTSILPTIVLYPAQSHAPTHTLIPTVEKLTQMLLPVPSFYIATIMSGMLHTFNAPSALTLIVTCMFFITCSTQSLLFPSWYPIGAPFFFHLTSGSLTCMVTLELLLLY